jgi:hypothetical protein
MTHRVRPPGLEAVRAVRAGALAGAGWAHRVRRASGHVVPDGFVVGPRDGTSVAADTGGHPQRARHGAAGTLSGRLPLLWHEIRLERVLHGDGNARRRHEQRDPTSPFDPEPLFRVLNIDLVLVYATPWGFLHARFTGVFRLAAWFRRMS